MNAVETDRLTKRYGRRLGVDGLSLAVPQGSVYGFIGPNGAGKTTTIRLLLGFLRADTGEARIGGLDCWRDARRVKRDIGYVPGDLRLPGWMTGRDALRVAGGARGTDLHGPGGELAETLRLELDVRVRNMSRGMRQKLGLILALAHDPAVLILDEPTSALDPVTQDVLFRILRQRAAERRTVFFSSHVLSEVQDLCDRVAILRNGRLVVEDSLSALRARSGRVVVVRWAAGAATDPPPFLQIVRRAGERWECRLDGDVQPLLRWAASAAIEDLTVGEPDLDSLFRAYYLEPTS